MFNKIIIFGLSIGLLLGASACFKYEPQYEGTYTDSDENIESLFPKELVYVANGNVYLADRFGKNPIILDDSGTVELASINNDHTRVIFKPANQNIQIYDVETETMLEDLNDTQDAIWFDYHSNNETIYFLRSNQRLDTRGPEVLVNRPLNFSNTIPNYSVNSVVVLTFGNVYAAFSGDAGQQNGRLMQVLGTTVVDSKILPVSLNNIRLEESRNRVVGGSFNNMVLAYSTIDLEKLQTFEDYKLAGGNGYFLSQEDVLIIPNAEDIEELPGEVTAIDF